MDKSIIIKSVITAIGGFCGWFLGGWDIALQVLVVMVIVDFVTGVLSAWFNGEVSSRIAFKCIPKKLMIFALVGVSEILDRLTNANDAFRTAAIFLYISMEGISILENAVEVGLPVPEVVVKALKLLKPNNAIESITQSQPPPPEGPDPEIPGDP